MAQSKGVPKISTGDILREAVQAGTDIGRAARSVMESGRLVGDDVMIAIARERLGRPDAQRGFILDGFPRTVAQAKALDKMLNGDEPLVIVDIEVQEETLVRRLSTRKICRNCGRTAVPGLTECAKCGGALVQRRDDNDEVVLERLRVHQRDTQPLVEYYSQRATFRSIDGDQVPDAVAADLAAAVASVSGVDQ